MSAASPISLVSSDDEGHQSKQNASSGSGTESSANKENSPPGIKLPSQLYTVSRTTWQGFPYYEPEERYTSVIGAYYTYEDARYAAWDAMGNDWKGREIRQVDDTLDFGSDAEGDREGCSVQIDQMDVFLPGSVPKSKRLVANEKKVEQRQAKRSDGTKASAKKGNMGVKGRVDKKLVKGKAGKKR